MKGPVRFPTSPVSSIKYLENNPKTDAQETEILLKKAYHFLVPVIKEAFFPIRKKILERKLDPQARKAWALLCQGLNREQSFSELPIWTDWERYFGGDVFNNQRIFSEFYDLVCDRLKKIKMYHPVSGQLTSVYYAMEETKELEKLTDFLKRDLPEDMGDEWSLRDNPYIPRSDVLVDYLFYKLLKGNDPFVSRLFEDACGFRALSKELGPINRICFNKRHVVVCAAGLNGFDLFLMSDKDFADIKRMDQNTLYLTKNGRYKAYKSETELYEASLFEDSNRVATIDSKKIKEQLSAWNGDYSSRLYKNVLEITSKRGHTRLKVLKSHEVEPSAMDSPTKTYQLCLHESDLPQPGKEGAICLSVPADCRTDMSACFLPTKPPFILSATGSFYLPENLFLRDGQLVVLGVPVENIVPPKGFSVVAPIDLETFLHYYKNREIKYVYDLFLMSKEGLNNIETPELRKIYITKDGSYKIYHSTETFSEGSLFEENRSDRVIGSEELKTQLSEWNGEANLQLCKEILEITSKRGHTLKYLNRFSQRIEIQSYRFSEKINLAEIEPDLFCSSSTRHLLESADPRYPLSPIWYHKLIYRCVYSEIPFPVSNLRTFHTPYALDLRGYSLRGLPLSFELPAPKRGLPQTKEAFAFINDPSRTYYAIKTEDPMLAFLQEGYHVINPQGWQILWRQGVRNFSAFKLVKKYPAGLRLTEKEELHLTHMHPEVMMTLPARSAVANPLGLEEYYCESLTRDYQAKERKKWAILTLGLSLLFFYICHCIRNSLIRLLPEASRPEVSQILARFKYRPITHAASDYLNYKFGQPTQEAGISRSQKRILFGALPDKDSVRYFDSMRYLPLFQTHRELTRFVQKTFRGTRQEKANYVQTVTQELSGITPWFGHTTPDAEIKEKNKRITRLLCQLLTLADKSPRLKKQFIYNLLRSVNSSFLILLVEHYLPLINAVCQEKIGVVIKNKKENSWFVNKIDVFLHGYASLYLFNPKRRQFEGCILLSTIFRIRRQIEKKPRVYGENLLANLEEIKKRELSLNVVDLLVSG